MNNEVENNVVNEEPVAEPTVANEPEKNVEIAQEQPAEEDAAVDVTAAEEPKRVFRTKQEVIERMKELAHGEETPAKDEVDLLKTTFYKLHFAEREAAMKEYLDNGGDPETYQVVPDADEETFKAEMGLIKEKRAQAFLEQEKEKEANLQRKLEIIEQIKNMATTPEDANKNFQEF